MFSTKPLAAVGPDPVREVGCRDASHHSAGLVLLALILFVMPEARADGALRNLEPGDLIPDFSCQGLDGKTYARADSKDKVLVLLFVNPGQKYSSKALRLTQRIVDACAAPKPSVLAVSTKPDGREAFAGLARQLPFTYPMALDAGRKAYGAFGVIVAPTTLVIDGKGVLRFVLPLMPPTYERQLRAHVDFLAGHTTAAQHAAALQGDSTPISGEAVTLDRKLALVRTLIDQRKHEMAIPILEKLASGDAVDPRVAELLGACHLAVGDLEAASRCLDPLAKQERIAPGLRRVLARLEVRRGNDDRAQAHLEAALKTAPKNGPLLYELGRLHERRGESDKAMACYRRALDVLYGSDR